MLLQSGVKTFLAPLFSALVAKNRGFLHGEYRLFDFMKLICIFSIFDFAS
jgi:hypothetical protein